jgi:hypothetical protein
LQKKSCNRWRLFESCSYLREGLADELLSFLVVSILPDACFTSSLTRAFVSEFADVVRTVEAGFCDFCSRACGVVEACLLVLFSILAGVGVVLALSVVLELLIASVASFLLLSEGCEV